MDLDWLDAAIEEAIDAVNKGRGTEPYGTVLKEQTEKIRKRILLDHNRILLALRQEVSGVVDKRITMPK